MKLIINHSSMQPIYEQIVEQTKEKIMHGELTEETMLPSVRTLGQCTDRQKGIRCPRAGRICQYGTWQGKFRSLCQSELDA